MALSAVESKHIDGGLFTQTTAQTELNPNDYIIFGTFEVFCYIPNFLHGVR